MKHLIFLFLLTIFSVITFAQDYNTIIIDEESEKPMLIGYCTREAFDDTSFSSWWNEEYEMYQVDVETADQLINSWDNVEITLVMSTWCSDSRREVPRFYKIVDEFGYSSENVHLINVNREMVGLVDEVDGLEIHFVPTFIFYRNDEEIGRIVEMPFDSLEKDMLEIVKN
ncbi:MAG: thioredoxin family protein [Ignavibacteriaceae bacterium]|nr:thioredoxin family protein [Ignavibacteriaceae bacterium]